MVQLILNQDHAIREQIRRMAELDLDIEEFEAQSEAAPHRAGQQLQEYLHASDGVQQLELQVQRHQELIRRLSRDIDAELRAGRWPGPDAGELEALRGEVKRSLLAGASLHSQAAEVDQQLKHYEATLVSKDQECWQLAAQLSSLQVGGGGGEEEACVAAAAASPPPESVPAAAKLKPGAGDAADTDSDTGISSTHSQDSLSPCPEFPPPLDTDV